MIANEQLLKEFFNELDIDKDGKLSILEIDLDNFGLKFLPQLTNTISFFQILEQSDSDKDQMITYDELKAAVEKAGNFINS